ncbi:MAG: class I SAM-dependent methyltransferase [Candidatus Omnitrophica bacterium]|nr:class I SAM-dependent methyltransferase [Candidatus Omnitrophota bacterium]
MESPSVHAQEYYKDYWKDEALQRTRRAYYQKLYDRVRSRLQVRSGDKILDVAGGNGQLMQYLGFKGAHILDISQSGLEAARQAGFHAIFGDIGKRFPMEAASYDVAFCFEVLEHLHYPNKTLCGVHDVLKAGGVLYVGQPNMRADGVHHVRRYRLNELIDDLKKAGFAIEWTDYVPAYSMRDSIVSDIRRNPSYWRKAIQCVNLTLSLLPFGIRYRMARIWPDRFALLFIVKAVAR